jgi:hypothetical protein
MSSSSSSGDVAFSMLTGQTAPNPDIIALFRIGDNDGSASGSHEYMLGDGSGQDAAILALGHLTWDPGYRAGRTPFFTVAPVRLDLGPQGVQWSVGTSDFIACPFPNSRRIGKIQIAATAADGAPGRLMVWDWIDVALHYEGEQHETYASPCLPKVSTTLPTRRAAGAPPANGLPLQQHVEIGLNAEQVSGVQIRGQVTLRASHDSRPLGPDDLQGRVLIYLK